MDENSALIESILREQEEADRGTYRKENDDAHGWQTVSNKKRNRKPSKPLQEKNSGDLRVNGVDSSSAVFRDIEQHSEERRRRLQEAQMASASASVDADVGRSKRHSDEDEDSDAEFQGANVENGSAEVKKVKQKKPKKPKVTVAEAASKIDVADLNAFLAEITVSYESQQEILLMRFADYFGRVFSSVSGAQFPWLKMFKESPVAKIVDLIMKNNSESRVLVDNWVNFISIPSVFVIIVIIPLLHISEDIYKISTDWIGQRSSEALGSFVLWLLDSILADLASHQGVAKGTKNVAQQASSKSQVAIFLVLAMVLRRKPDVMISLLPILKETQKYQGQDKLPLTVWVIAQASQGDLVMGLYLWVSLLLPMLSSKSGCNPQSRDLILQSVERILSSPKARTILLNGAVRKGERVVPPSALDTLWKITFPLPSARVKATERFEAVYPTLKDVALAGSPGSKAMKQLAQQISNIAFKAAGEANPDLSKEASEIFIWCLTQNPECYKQWDTLYMDNLEASVVVLRKLSEEWREHSLKHPTLDPLRETLKSFRQKNDKALDKEDDGARQALLKDADKHCKVILRHVSKGHGCMKGMAVVSVVLGVGAVLLSQNMDSWDYNKLSEMLKEMLQ
ncbi:Transmembrane protein 214-A [Senna tora]|uniref:Transmembrane protein 214-A n=1 Tax=Senna tora TaxID=362788 RepID=A0A834WQL1_9FABA|nr:Transmembrane protein 214-A [Senna tora]